MLTENNASSVRVCVCVVGLALGDSRSSDALLEPQKTKNSEWPTLGFVPCKLPVVQFFA